MTDQNTSSRLHAWRELRREAAHRAGPAAVAELAAESQEAHIVFAGVRPVDTREEREAAHRAAYADQLEARADARDAAGIFRPREAEAMRAMAAELRANEDAYRQADARRFADPRR